MNICVYCVEERIFRYCAEENIDNLQSLLTEYYSGGDTQREIANEFAPDSRNIPTDV